MTTINTAAPTTVHAAIAYLHSMLSKEHPVPASLVDPVVHIHGTTPLARAILDRLTMRAWADAQATGPACHVDQLLRYRGGRNARNWSPRRAIAWMRSLRSAAAI